MIWVDTYQIKNCGNIFRINRQINKVAGYESNIKINCSSIYQ